MIEALDLDPDAGDPDEISLEYRATGFKRERHLFALRKGDSLVAVISMVLSDVGLNMSELTNCVTVFVLEPEELDKELLQEVLKDLVARFHEEEMPVLIYPAKFAEDRGITFEKTYNLWVLSMQHTDRYFSYLERLLKAVKSWICPLSTNENSRLAPRPTATVHLQVCR